MFSRLRALSPFTKSDGGTGRSEKGLTDEEKAARAYEDDEELRRSQASGRRGSRRLSKSVTSGKRKQPLIGSFAPNPSFIRLIRFLLFALVSGFSIATAALCISVVSYYNTHGPAIKPAWGSLIAVIVFGLGTPFFLFGNFLVVPRLFKYGSPLAIISQVRVELLGLFGLCAVWISGALALAVDLRGRENCLWDGYYHYPKPADFDQVCTLINNSVALAYTTFGLTAVLMSLVWIIAIYILLFLDQEVLTEEANDMGGRAYRARTLALSRQRALIMEQEEAAGIRRAGPNFSDVGGPIGGVRDPTMYSDAGYTEGSTMGGGPMMEGGAPASRRIPPNFGSSTAGDSAYRAGSSTQYSPPGSPRVRSPNQPSKLTFVDNARRMSGGSEEDFYEGYDDGRHRSEV